MTRSQWLIIAALSLAAIGLEFLLSARSDSAGYAAAGAAEYVGNQP